MSKDDKDTKSVYKLYREAMKKKREIRKKVLGIEDKDSALMRVYDEATKTRRAVKAEIFGNEGKGKDTSIEIFVEDFLKENNIEYVPQKALRWCNYDFYLTEENIAIEVMGEFWHCDARVYPEGPKNEIQRKNLDKNTMKRDICKSLEIPLIEIWEYDINLNPQNVKEKMLKTIKNPPHFKLYYLKCPKTKEIKYVGITQQKLSSRLKSHLSCKSNMKKFLWIKSLRSEGLKPIIECVISELAQEEAWELEISTIERFRDEKNIELLNVADGGQVGISMPGDENPMYGLTGSLSPFSTKILQCDKKNSVIKLWNSQTEAAKNLKLRKQNINKCLKERRKTCGGFTWRYLNEEDSKSWFNKHIDEDQLKEMFNRNISYHRMAEFFGVNRHTLATRISLLGLERGPKKVKQLTKDGKQIKEYESVYFAEKETGISGGNIWHTCVGNRKTAGGFKWEFV